MHNISLCPFVIESFGASSDLWNRINVLKVSQMNQRINEPLILQMKKLKLED